MKRIQKKASINLKLTIYFSAFALAIIFILWVLQVWGLNPYYEIVKKFEVKKVATKIEEYIDKDQRDEYIRNIAYQYNMCVEITDIFGNHITGAETAPFCIVHSKSPQNSNLSELIDRLEEEKQFLDIVNTKSSFLGFFGDDRDMYDHILTNGNVYNRYVLSGKIIKSDSQTMYMFICTSLTPLNSTVGILQSQITVIAVILLLLSLALGIVISKNISLPIISITKSAKKLASNNYNTVFKGGGFKEIDELAETLNKASEELSINDNLRRELMANVSHDLRTPITMIKAYAEMLRDFPSETKPENLQVIIDESDRLTILINDIISLSKLESNAEAINIEEYDITSGIREIINRYSVLKGINGYTFEFISDGDEMVYADPAKIQQVIYNLINNAINYSPDNSLITVVQKRIDNSVRIEVKDRGEGIPEEKLKYIWDRYYKVDKIHKRAVIGSGLGLSIVKNILLLHNAKFGVESTEGEGSTFWFELPSSKKIY
mgnify:CR=1 FL=1